MSGPDVPWVMQRTRWRRPLPESDEAIASLTAEQRALLAALWERRAASELGAGAGFAVLVTELYGLGADTAVLQLATGAAQDEVRHAELCRVLASAYRGAEVAPPRARTVELPAHGGADEVLRSTLHVVGLCCINETIAAGFIEACLRVAEAPLVRAIHREHLSDEVHHARVGWAHLASGAVGEVTRQAVARWLPRLLAANLEHWRARIGELPEHGVPGHGYPPRATLLGAVRSAVQDIVLPGFAHVGIDPGAARMT